MSAPTRVFTNCVNANFNFHFLRRPHIFPARRTFLCEMARLEINLIEIRNCRQVSQSISPSNGGIQYVKRKKATEFFSEKAIFPFTLFLHEAFRHSITRQNAWKPFYSIEIDMKNMQKGTSKGLTENSWRYILISDVLHKNNSNSESRRNIFFTWAIS